jgi:DNA-binding winged helix-turn-helix (wHTH) protein
MKTRSHAGGDADPALNVRFGPFELDLRGGELRKEGRRIRLQEQPFQILQMLLESLGQVVSREDIRKRLWVDNTVVEFDHSISAAVRRLRDALRDSADKPRYIETVARRGYRFIGEVEAAVDDPSVVDPVAAAAANELTDGQAGPEPGHPRLRVRSWMLVSLASAIIVVWASVGYNSRTRRPAVAPLQPLIRLDLDLGDEMRAAVRTARGKARWTPFRCL